MPRKVLLGTLLGTLFLAGCATPSKEVAPAVPAPAAATAKPRTVAVTAAKPRATARPAQLEIRPPSTAPSRADLPAMIGHGAQWTSYGFRSLALKQGAPAQPVPIFRQAGTLAAVRAALADSPARPQAEFRNGVLALNFGQGSNEEIAAAVKKAVTVAGTRNLQVTLQP